jgi:signal transduction histidine kinase/ActR/RegA family two-component response regulator
MNEQQVISLIQNIAVLLAFAMLYENFWLRNDKLKGIISQTVAGFVLGIIGIVLMFTPWTLTPGLVFDVRSVMLAVSGVFFGPVPTVIAMVLAGITRYFMGGDGMWMGIATIVSSGTIGIFWGEWRKKWKRINRPVEFLALGLVVHIVMMGATMLLPDEMTGRILRIIILPLFLIYTPGTMLLGMLLAAQKRNYQNQVEKEKLYEKEYALRNELTKHQQQIAEQLEKYGRLNKEYRVQNEELTRAKEKAEESDRLKSAFLANLSHEIRTPMNAIMGFADLLESEKLNGETHEKYIRIIRKSGGYLLSIINDIVEISQIEAGQVELNENEIEINELMDEVFNSFKTIIASRENLTLKLEKPNPPLNEKIWIDEVKLKQILMNLINNAIKFTEHGEVSFGYTTKNSSEISVFVKDTGIGIAPEKHHVIFERFRQVDSKNTKIQSGSGLGLSITKAYTEIMGGNISVESEEGKGAEFVVTFPLVPVNNSPSNKVFEKKEEPIAVSNGNRIILVAEDEDVNWYLIEQVLSRYNYKLFRAENGLEAVEFCKNNKDIDLVLMDIKMPVMNGFDALEEIRKINPKLPVIAQTAYALSGDVERIKSVFDDYITKPINRQILIEKIAFATSLSSSN